MIKMGSYQNCVNGEAEPPKLTSSASFKAKKKPAAAISRAGSEADDIITLLHGSDPVRVELTRLENEVRGMCRFVCSMELVQILVFLNSSFWVNLYFIYFYVADSVIWKSKLFNLVQNQFFLLLPSPKSR